MSSCVRVVLTLVVVCVCFSLFVQFPSLLASLPAEEQTVLGKFFQTNKVNLR